MKDRLPHDRLEGRIARTTPKVNAVERRSAQRQNFIAEAQIVEISSGAKVAARSCDLVVHGCYVDTLNPFPVGTLVRVRLKKDKTIIEANGNVVYRMLGLGMGIAFHDLTPESHEALEQWLLHIPAERDSFANPRPPPQPDASMARQQSAGQFAELVQMLRSKGILSRTEAARLLNESLEDSI